MEEKIRSVTKNQCSGCGRYFASVIVFDMHHKGKPAHRRCMTEQEMCEIGLATEKRNVRSYIDGHPHQEMHDVWYWPLGRERVRQAFGRGDEDADEAEEETEEETEEEGE